MSGTVSARASVHSSHSSCWCRCSAGTSVYLTHVNDEQKLHLIESMSPLFILLCSCVCVVSITPFDTRVCRTIVRNVFVCVASLRFARHSLHLRNRCPKRLCRPISPPSLSTHLRNRYLQCDARCPLIIVLGCQVQ